MPIDCHGSSPLGNGPLLRGILRLAQKYEFGPTREIEEEARQLGLTELTTEASIVAMPLAERQGFEVVKKQIKVHRGIEFLNYVIRKKL